MSRPRVVVYVDGGVVQDVYGTAEVDVVIVDSEVDPKDATAVVDGYPAWVFHFPVEAAAHVGDLESMRQAFNAAGIGDECRRCGERIFADEGFECGACNARMAAKGG